MPPDARLIVCPSCACHAKLSETHCPECGARLRSYDGWIAPAAAVVAMGLTTVTTCSDGKTSSSGAGAGGDGGMGGMTSQVSNSISAAYVVASTVDVGPGPGSSGMGGAAGAGGSGGAAGSGGAGGAGGSGG